MKKIHKQIGFSARLPFIVKKREKWYLSSCPILDVHSQGTTREEAIDNLKEALSLFLMTCFERGTLDKVMKQCGFVGAQTEKISQRKQPRNLLDIPIPLQWNQPERTQCHV